MWMTRRSWSRRRRVVAKAEWTKGEVNPRFVVTSLRREECKVKYLYETVYCARGDMENRIKECQLDLYADRTSAATMRANQLHLWFHSMARPSRGKTLRPTQTRKNINHNPHPSAPRAPMARTSSGLTAGRRFIRLIRALLLQAARALEPTRPPAHIILNPSVA
jgi:hypothetical protein